MQNELEVKNKQLDELHFSEPLFLMSYGSRMAVRIISSTWLIVQAAATLIFLLSNIPWLFWLGLISTLYLLDRALHYNQADHSFKERYLDKGSIDLYLTPRAKQSLISAYDTVTLVGGNFLLNLARNLLEAAGVREIFSRLEINTDEFLAKLDEYLSRRAGSKEDQKRIISQAEQLVLTAFRDRKADQQFIDQVDLFTALGRSEDEDLRALFNLFAIDPGELARAAVFGRLRHRLLGPLVRAKATFGSLLVRPTRSRHRIMNRAWTARPTPLLDALGTDLTDLARAGRIGLLIGHQAESNRLIDILSRVTKPNALLVGEAGSGRETIVEHLAYLIVHDQVPPQLFDKRLVTLNTGGLIAGADQGEIQRRIEEVFNEIYKAKNIILYIPDIHNLSRTAGPKGLSAANTVLPLLTSSNIPTIGATFPQEFKEFIERDSLFGEAFEVIRVNEVSPEEAELILAYRALFLEKEAKVTITYGAIRAAVQLAGRYFRPKLLPSSADDLLKEAVADAANKKESILKSDDVIDTAEKRTNVPIGKVSAPEAEQLLHLEDTIHRRLSNQEEAVKAVSNALREYRSGLSRQKGPIGVYLFVGPTGVGKTELAKALAEVQFGSEEAMIRFDMSEYQTRESIYRFIGSPEGEASGRLTEAILEKPYSLILLDEFEKAHPDIWNLFLQVFDDGRLTDSLGRVVDFTNTIIIATSNAHSDMIHQALQHGESMASIADYLKKLLVDVFKPELLNRFSAIVVFKDLGIGEIEAITKLRLNELISLLKDSHGVDLEYSEGAIQLLARKGYDPSFGARPLGRVISDELREPLSEKIIGGEIKRGAKVMIDASGESLKIEITNEA